MTSTVLSGIISAWEQGQYACYLAKVYDVVHSMTFGIIPPTLPQHHCMYELLLPSGNIVPSGNTVL